MGIGGLSFSAKAAQTEVGRGCLCLFLLRDFVRPRLHSCPSSSSYTFIEEVSLESIVEVVALSDVAVVVAVAVVSLGKTLK